MTSQANFGHLPKPSADAPLPRRACVVVIGGGAAGCSVAYHLTKRGWTDVVVLERGLLSCGTTWHSAGDIPLMKPTGLIGLVRYGAELYANLEAETGQSVGWRNCGYLKVARTKARFEEYKRYVSTFNALGGVASIVDPARVRELFPLASVGDLLGGVWEPGSGRVDPTGLVAAYAKAARRGGAIFIEHCAVESIEVSNGRATGITTTQGKIQCDVVVNCAGLWARRIGSLAGVSVPLHATEHFYMLTKPIAGVHSGLPILNDPDGSIYMREDVGGLLVGCFEPNAKPLPLERLPAEFSFSRLEEDWDHVEPYMLNAMQRVPALQTAELRLLMNGPESFTPDGSLLVGEASELRSFYVLAGFNSGGVAMSAGMGRTLAEWIIDGQPNVDMTRCDIRRFSGIHNNTKWLASRVSEIVGLHMAVPTPGRDYATGRQQRLSPFHTWMQSKGAQFGSMMGWERPLWFGEIEPRLENPFGKPWSHPFAAEEHRATRERVALFDLSSFGKLLISGADATSAVERIFANSLDVPVGRSVYTAMLNERGGIESDLTVIRLAEQEYLAVTGAAQTSRDLDWLRRHIDPALRASVVDVSSAYGVLGVKGPHSRQLLSRLVDADLSNSAFPYKHANYLSIGGARVLAVRVSYTGELGWELYVTADAAHHLTHLLWETGSDLGVSCAGYHALASLRMEKAYRSWGRDLSPGTSPAMAGLLFAVDFGKDFIGKEALLAEVSAGPPRRLTQFSVDMQGDWLFGDEPIYWDGQFAGLVTSAAYGHTVGAMLAFAYLDGEAAKAANSERADGFEIDVGGTRRLAKPLLNAPFDPAGERLRS